MCLHFWDRRKQWPSRLSQLCNQLPVRSDLIATLLCAGFLLKLGPGPDFWNRWIGGLPLLRQSWIDIYFFPWLMLWVAWTAGLGLDLLSHQWSVEPARMLRTMSRACGVATLIAILGNVGGIPKATLEWVSANIASSMAASGAAGSAGSAAGSTLASLDSALRSVLY